MIEVAAMVQTTMHLLSKTPTSLLSGRSTSPMIQDPLESSLILTELSGSQRYPCPTAALAVALEQDPENTESADGTITNYERDAECYALEDYKFLPSRSQTAQKTSCCNEAGR